MPEPVHPTLTPDQAADRLRQLATRWRTSTLGERAAFQSWFNEFCDALGVARPGPDHGEDYCFEKPVLRSFERGDTTGFIDCWKAGHFAVEAKASGNTTAEPLLRRAFKQLSDYVAAEPGTVPPYLMVVDVPRELILWEGWRGFGGFAGGTRIQLDTLADAPEHIALLQDVFARPHARDPRGKAQQVTRDIAGKLAELAAAFEDRGHDSEPVARFLMRCVFCFFAEDVGLLPRQLFKRTLESARNAGGAERVAAVLTSLWRTMDVGGDFGADLIQHFNGHFFKSVESLPLEPADIDLLIEAAGFDWSGVEPSIFGTLLVRALEPAERHKLGAEYTPREYIERLVEPTVVEPIRERWNAVQARVVQLESADAPDPVGATPRVARAGRSQQPSKARREAVAEVLAFHTWLRGLRFLDPACGSGNFLYVTMAAVKRIELEVFRELERLQGTAKRTHQLESMVEEVHPRQFHGIEVNWWAREIAELTLWIGYHQFWREAHGGRTPPEPILEDTGTIECRDAILAWDEIVHRPEKDRPDPTPRLVHPVTGELVPDPAATLPYLEYVGARQAEWPEADFIVGNPPYIGKSRKREALGDGYVDAIQLVYPQVPPASDLVMIWWWRGAAAVKARTALHCGLITTNSIVQDQNQRVVMEALDSGISIAWAIADHPWVDERDGAAVRVAMTVTRALGRLPARLLVKHDSIQSPVLHTVRTIHADLSGGPDVARVSTSDLTANAGLCTVGYKLYGKGFVLDKADGEALLTKDTALATVVRPYRTASDLARRSRDAYVIDFGTRSQDESARFPVPFDLVRSRVKPHRDANNNLDIRSRWWQFGHLRPQFRQGVDALARYIATPETSKHRFFEFLDSRIAPEGSLVCTTSDAGWLLGVLSSALHVEWSEAIAGKLGIGNDFRYNKRCFDPFPFPDPAPELRDRISAIAERLDQHRKDAIARDERVTMTGMYNVVAKLRSGEALTPKERAIHEVAACGVLRDLHDELDTMVAEAYGWPWPMEREEILERLVTLHDERVAEEAAGRIRWLRPEYQMPRFAPKNVSADLGLDTPDAPDPKAGEAAPRPAWPATAVEQIALVQALVGRGVRGAAAIVAAIDGADRKLVARHLGTLEMLGEA